MWSFGSRWKKHKIKVPELVRAITLPIPGFVSVVCLAIFRRSRDWIQFAPGLPSGSGNFTLFFLPCLSNTPVK